MDTQIPTNLDKLYLGQFGAQLHLWLPKNQDIRGTLESL